MMENPEIIVKRVSDAFPEIPLPEYTTPGSAGMDIRAALKEPSYIEPGKFQMIPTNLIVEIPEGFEIQVRPRSGLAAKYGIGVLNSPGTIDSDYRGEVKVILFNFGSETFTINSGDRIAQLVLSRVFHAKVTESTNVGSTSRGAGGFGHSGIK